MMADVLPEFAGAICTNPARLSTSATEIVFIDSKATDADARLDAILASTRNSRIQVVYLDPKLNGIEAISQALADQGGLMAAHILSNGFDGQLQLGNVYLCDANIGSYAGHIAAWQMAFTSDAELRIHGCNLDSQAGEYLLEDLKVLTAARVVPQ